MRRLSGVLSLLVTLVAAALVLPGVADAGPITTADATSPVRATTTALVETSVIGHTVKGRKIKAYRIGDPAAPVKVVLVGTIHGNEAGPAKLLMNLVTGAPVSGADIWVVPFLNRDGFKRHTRRNAHHVDLNRNFPVHWIRQYGDYNSGRKPASEPETRALMRFLKAIRPAYVVGFHQPLYGVDNSYTKTRAFAGRLSVNLGLPLKLFRCNHRCHGTMTQWFNKRLPGVALTVEYGKPMTLAQKYSTGPAGLLASIGASR
jgi:predicted deacylase